MTIELDPSGGDVIAFLHEGIRDHFGARFIGLYLYGSAVYGDFVIGTSDLDLVCAIADDATIGDVEYLQTLHRTLDCRWPEFIDRIEVQYANVHRIRTFREQRFTIANISPGEPIHLIETGTEWLMNWYFAVHYSRTIAGPPPADVFPVIDSAEFVQSARDHARWWLDQPGRMETQKGQSYAALTLSRALYTHRTGHHVSKEQAVRYVAAAYPDWASLLADALRWRIEPDRPAPLTSERAASFVRQVAALIDHETRQGGRASC